MTCSLVWKTDTLVQTSCQVVLPTCSPVRNSCDSYFYYINECFTAKYANRRFHMKLHTDYEWNIFHILTSEDIVDVISDFADVILVQKRFHSFAALTRNIFFPLEDRLHMFSQPCNILYVKHVSRKVFNVPFAVYGHIFIYLLIDWLIFQSWKANDIIGHLVPYKMDITQAFWLACNKL